MAKIDLGRTPETAPTAPTASTADADNTSYPSLYIDGDSKDLTSLPDSGQMTVTFKKTSHTVRTSGGKTTSSVALDILSIDDVEPADDSDDSGSGNDDSGAALDKAAQEEAASQPEEEEPEK